MEPPASPMAQYRVLGFVGSMTTSVNWFVGATLGMAVVVFVQVTPPSDDL